MMMMMMMEVRTSGVSVNILQTIRPNIQEDMFRVVFWDILIPDDGGSTHL
jgi:hypothetical protein